MPSRARPSIVVTQLASSLHDGESSSGKNLCAARRPARCRRRIGRDRNPS